jgi:hypothetical protein
MQPVLAKSLRNGLIAGLIGYAVTAVYYSIIDVLMGQPPWHTLSNLGNALFVGIVDTPGPLIAFNGIHLAAFIVVGVIAAFQMEEVELHPVFWYVPFFAALAASIFMFVLIVMTMGSIAQRGAVAIGAGNFAAAAAMLVYLVSRHGGLVHRIDETV